MKLSGECQEMKQAEMAAYKRYFIAGHARAAQRNEIQVARGSAHIYSSPIVFGGGLAEVLALCSRLRIRSGGIASVESISYRVDWMQIE